MHTWRSEDRKFDNQFSFFFFSTWVPRDGTQVLRLGVLLCAFFLSQVLPILSSQHLGGKGRCVSVTWKSASAM